MLSEEGGDAESGDPRDQKFHEKLPTAPAWLTHMSRIHMQSFRVRRGVDVRLRNEIAGDQEASPSGSARVYGEEAAGCVSQRGEGGASERY